jgi:hypothetical protein
VMFVFRAVATSVASWFVERVLSSLQDENLG